MSFSDWWYCNLALWPLQVAHKREKSHRRRDEETALRGEADETTTTSGEKQLRQHKQKHPLKMTHNRHRSNNKMWGNAGSSESANKTKTLKILLPLHLNLYDLTCWQSSSLRVQRSGKRRAAAFPTHPLSYVLIGHRMATFPVVEFLNGSFVFLRFRQRLSWSVCPRPKSQRRLHNPAWELPALQRPLSNDFRWPKSNK